MERTRGNLSGIWPMLASTPAEGTASGFASVSNNDEAHRSGEAQRLVTVNPNDRCPCGSGRKYKRCCAGKVRRREARTAKLTKLVVAVLFVGIVAAVVAAVMSGDSDRTGPRRVWSPEHDHWHDVP